MATVRERIAAAKLEDQRLAQTGGRSVRDRIAAAKEQERVFTQADHVKTVSKMRQAREQAAEKQEFTAAPIRTGVNLYSAVLDRAARKAAESKALSVPSSQPTAVTQDTTVTAPGKSGAFGGGSKKTYDTGFTGGRKTSEERADWGKIAAGTAYGGLQQFTKGLSATAAMLEKPVAQAAGWVLGNDQLYQDAPFYKINQNMDKEIAAHQALMKPEYEKAGKAGELVEKYGVPTVAAVPQAISAFLTFGQSLAAQGTTAGLQAASTAAQSTGVAKIAGMVADGLKNTAANPQFWLSFLSTAGPEYEQAKADGADDKKAYAYAALSGALNSLVEVGGGIDKLPDVSQNALKEWAGSMIDEGKEEVVQGMISRALQRGMYGKNNPLFSTTNEDAVINPFRSMEEFAGGAVVGGILGGAQLGVQRAMTGPQKTFGEAVQEQIMGNQPQSAAETVPQVQAPQAPQAQKNAAQEQTIRAGRASEIKNPYQGQTPNYRKPENTARPQIDEKAVAAAQDQITAAQQRGAQTGKSFKNFLEDFYENEFQETGGARGIAVAGAEMDGKPYVVTVNKSAVGKVISDRNVSAEKLAVFGILDDVIENGEYVGSSTYEQKGKKQKNTIRFDLFETPVTIGGKDYIVTFDVEVFPSSNNYRTHKVVNEMDLVPVEAPDTGTGQPQQQPIQGPFGGGEKNSFSTPSVPQTGGNVNPPGVEISDRAKKQLSGADQRTLQNLSQITGSNIQFVTREQMDQMAGPGAEGVQRNGQIYISEDAQRPYMEIAKHEITHRLQQTAPENYAKLRDRVADLYRGKGVLDKYLRGVMEDHARAGMEITEEAALDEITANYAEDLMWDEKAVRELAGEDRGLLTRMLDALRDFISKVKTALGGKGNAETAELEQSAAMWQAALEESAGNKGKTVETAERVGSFSDEIARQLAGGDQRLATREGAELKRQIEALSRQNQRLREQMKRTTGSEMDEKSVRQLSRSILKDYSSSYAVDDLSSRVSELYKKIAEQTISDTDARAEARAIAGDILDGSQTEINPLYEEYSELRKELKTRPIAVSKDLKSGMVEAWGDFRRQNLGRLKLGNDGTQVDVLYDELSDRFPEFFPEDIINPADQLARMAEVADELQSVMGNAYEGAEMDRMADFLAGDILERFLETPRRAPTFADRQAKKLEAERQRGLDALERQKAMFEGRSEREMEKLRRLREGQLWDQRKRFEKERARDRKAHQEAFERQKELLKKRDDKIAELKEKHRRQNKERSENRTASQRREQILRHVKRLSEKLLKPTDKAHIPEKLRTAAIVLLQTIDTESNYEYGPGGRLPIGAGDQPGAQTGLQGIVQTKRTLAARELQAQYAKLVEDAAKNGDIMTIDPDLAGYLDNIAEMGDTPLSDLNKDQLVLCKV